MDKIMVSFPLEEKMQSFLRDERYSNHIGVLLNAISVITLFNFNLRVPSYPFLLSSLEWKKIDTELPVIIHILSLACQLEQNLFIRGNFGTTFACEDADDQLWRTTDALFSIGLDKVIRLSIYFCHSLWLFPAFHRNKNENAKCSVTLNTFLFPNFFRSEELFSLSPFTPFFFSHKRKKKKETFFVSAARLWRPLITLIPFLH